VKQNAATTPAETREKLIRSTIEVFSEKGYEGTRLAEVAKRSGMTTGAIYSRFGGKEELLAEAVWEASGRPVDEWIYDGIGAPGSTIERIRALLHGIFRLKDRDLHVEAMVARRRSSRFADVLTRQGNTRRDRMVAILAQAAEEGELDPDLDREAVAYLMLSILSGVALLEVANGDRPGEPEWAAVVDRLLSGLRPETSRKGDAGRT
jgi:AcrR family transcriptional regulator